MKRLTFVLLTILSALLPSVYSDNVFRDGDVFEMRLSGPPEEFTREFSLVLTVDEGSVNLPLVGRIRAVGLSSTQLASSIEKRLKDEKIFSIANVNITLNQTQNQRMLIVGGAVRVPGRQPWVQDLTLMGAISSAGGVNEWVKDSVKIVRGGASQRFSLKAIKRGTAPDPRVQAGDIIEVEGDN
jgi:protein involved in polysaccharide export with SLBB domain